MKTLKWEVYMLPSEKNNKGIKIKKTFKRHFPGLVWCVVLSVIEVCFYEWKIRKRAFFGYLKKNVTLKRPVIASEVRIIILLIANVAASFWLVDNNIISAKLNYNLAKGEANEPAEFPIMKQEVDLNSILKLETEGMKETKKETKKNNEEAPKDIRKISSVLPPQEERCEEEKEEKISSDRCEENYAQYLAEEKEKMKKFNADWIQKKPVIHAPRPYVFDVEKGKKVCNKKNDHPGKSKNNKRGHMDMECCLDPDEIPNPHCYYSPSKYGKYLSKK